MRSGLGGGGGAGGPVWGGHVGVVATVVSLEAVAERLDEDGAGLGEQIRLGERPADGSKLIIVRNPIR